MPTGGGPWCADLQGNNSTINIKNSSDYIFSSDDIFRALGVQICMGATVQMIQKKTVQTKVEKAGGRALVCKSAME